MERLTYREKGSIKSVKPHQAIKKLGKLEDLEERGKLLRLPCKIGAKVYVLAECIHVNLVLDGTMHGTATGWYCPYELNDKCPHDCEDCREVVEKTAVFEDTINAMQYDETGITLFTEHTGVSSTIGEYIFLTREEAEKALAERG